MDAGEALILKRNSFFIALSLGLALIHSDRDEPDRWPLLALFDKGHINFLTYIG